MACSLPKSIRNSYAGEPGVSVAAADSKAADPALQSESEWAFAPRGV